MRLDYGVLLRPLLPGASHPFKVHNDLQVSETTKQIDVYLFRLIASSGTTKLPIDSKVAARYSTVS